MRRLGKTDMAALAALPADGSFLELSQPAMGVKRPVGVTLRTWDRVSSSWVPDSFWKPEYEVDGRHWVVFERSGPVGPASRRHVRLSAAGLALVRHYAETGKIPRQEA